MLLNPIKFYKFCSSKDTTRKRKSQDLKWGIVYATQIVSKGLYWEYIKSSYVNKNKNNQYNWKNGWETLSNISKRKVNEKWINI